MNPVHALPRLARITLAALAATAAIALWASPASAHPGPMQNGIHLCDQAAAGNRLCTPAGSYHSHTPEGNMILAPSPTGAPPPTLVPTAGAAAAPGAPAAAPTPAPAAAAPVPGQPLAATGRASTVLAVFGGAVVLAGLVALGGTRLVPLPVVLELDRRSLA